MRAVSAPNGTLLAASFLIENKTRRPGRDSIGAFLFRRINRRLLLALTNVAALVAPNPNPPYNISNLSATNYTLNCLRARLILRFTRRKILQLLSLAFGVIAAGIAGAITFFRGRERNTKMSFTKTNPEAIKQRFAIDFQWPTIDPFLFCAYHKDAYPRGNAELGPQANLADRELGMDFTLRDGFRMYHGKSIPGFPVHPHRGFETVTIVREGLVDHADSMGAAGRYGNGDVQWMTAGKGVQHSEMFPLLTSDKENHLELFQVWLNLPKVSKFAEPHFTMFWNHDVPRIKQDGATIELIAGTYGDVRAPAPPPESWASKPENHLAIWVIKVEKGGKLLLPKTVPGLSRVLYFPRGKELILGGGREVVGQGFALASDQALSIENAESEPAELLLLQGRPIGEPVAQRGPFVMNTDAEIQQAFSDYRQTQFGGWSWARPDMVHGPTQGRFALYPDGKREEPA